MEKVELQPRMRLLMRILSREEYDSILIESYDDLFKTPE